MPNPIPAINQGQGTVWTFAKSPVLLPIVTDHRLNQPHLNSQPSKRLAPVIVDRTFRKRLINAEDTFYL